MHPIQAFFLFTPLGPNRCSGILSELAVLVAFLFLLYRFHLIPRLRSGVRLHLFPNMVLMQLQNEQAVSELLPGHNSCRLLIPV